MVPECDACSGVHGFKKIEIFSHGGAFGGVISEGVGV